MTEEKPTANSICSLCAEMAEKSGRPVQFRVPLPEKTTKRQLVVRVCPHCDGKEVIQLANRG